MRVLITWGSKRGGTEGIAHIVGEVLTEKGFEVTLASTETGPRVAGFDAVIVGGALYANRWPSSARRFVRRNLHALRAVPVWFFSSGPLDDSAERAELPVPVQVAVLAERVGAKPHTTFGGRLAPDAHGFPASAMAKTNAGDWRNPEHIRAWATRLANELPAAKPGAFREPPARSIPRLLGHAVLGWAACAATMFGLLQLTSPTVALVVHAIAAPIVFAGVAWRYFQARGARDPLPTAVTFTAVVALLDFVIVAGAIERSFAMFGSVAGTWLPLALIFLVTWATGGILSTKPWPERSSADPSARSAH